jgi:putative membrane protein
MNSMNAHPSQIGMIGYSGLGLASPKQSDAVRPQPYSINHMQPSPEYPEKEPYNLTNELARERTRAAADRTLMAWIRTALSLIGFGFGIPTIVKAIDATRLGQHIDPFRFSTIVGLAFISVGMFGIGAALKEHHETLKCLQSNRYIYKSSNTAEIVGIALLLIGLLSFVGVLIRAIDL